jgi:hypothetical protein
MALNERPNLLVELREAILRRHGDCAGCEECNSARAQDELLHTQHLSYAMGAPLRQRNLGGGFQTVRFFRLSLTA